jgi:hypothetical protein
MEKIEKEYKSEGFHVRSTNTKIEYGKCISFHNYQLAMPYMQ